MVKLTVGFEVTIITIIAKVQVIIYILETLIPLDTINSHNEG